LFGKNEMIFQHASSNFHAGTQTSLILFS
jgi:hypothetical protein